MVLLLRVSLSLLHCIAQKPLRSHLGSGNQTAQSVPGLVKSASPLNINISLQAQQTVYQHTAIVQSNLYHHIFSFLSFRKKYQFH